MTHHLTCLWVTMAGLLVSPTSFAEPIASDKLQLHGSSRLCYGDLQVKPKSFSWLTPVSQCKTSKFTLVLNEQTSDLTRLAWRLEKKSAKCQFAMVMIHHKGDPSADTEWVATGYASVKDFELDQQQNWQHAIGQQSTLHCAMTRD